MTDKLLGIRENAIVLEDLNDIVSRFSSWKFFQDQKVFITGGNGLLASYLVRVLLFANNVLDLNLQVTCLVRSKKSDLSRLKPWINSSSLHLVYGDVVNYNYEQMAAQSIVVHAASGASPKLYQVDPVGIILPNSIGTAKLCQQSSEWDSKRFLYFSTGEVYGINNNSSFTENDYGYLDPSTLRSCYAESKRCGESTCVAYANQFNLHTTIARIFHTYGPQMRLDDGRVFADFISDSLSNDFIKLTSKGDALRCFCYIADATVGFLHLIVFGESGQSYNLANPKAEISIRDLGLLISNLTHPPLPLVYNTETIDQSKYLASKVPKSLPSIAKINAIGWYPTTSLQDGFSRTRASYLQ